MRYIKSKSNKPKIISLKDYYNSRNKVLIVREIGGLGDIFMHRMMFEDFKNASPDIELYFACPKQYHPAVEDHPFLDGLLDSKEVNFSDFVCSYNTTTACGRYETAKAPFADLHRSDIWAQHCGMILTNHSMHINLTDDEKKTGERLVDGVRGGNPVVAFAPISAQINKNLSESKIVDVILGIKDRGYTPLVVHSSPIQTAIDIGAPMLSGLPLRQWMAVVNACDYVVSVDTSCFHLAGGLGKPLVGIFSFVDGKVYGKYFNFELVQLHRDNGNWSCGPCYNWAACPKTRSIPKPCITELSSDQVLNGFDRLIKR